MSGEMRKSLDALNKVKKIKNPGFVVSIVLQSEDENESQEKSNENDKSIKYDSDLISYTSSED